MNAHLPRFVCRPPTRTAPQSRSRLPAWADIAARSHSASSGRSMWCRRVGPGTGSTNRSCNAVYGMPAPPAPIPPGRTPAVPSRTVTHHIGHRPLVSRQPDPCDDNLGGRIRCRPRWQPLRARSSARPTRERRVFNRPPRVLDLGRTGPDRHPALGIEHQRQPSAVRPTWPGVPSLVHRQMQLNVPSCRAKSCLVGSRTFTRPVPDRRTASVPAACRWRCGRRAARVRTLGNRRPCPGGHTAPPSPANARRHLRQS